MTGDNARLTAARSGRMRMGKTTGFKGHRVAALFTLFI